MSFIELVEMTHKFQRNGFRVNVDDDPSHFRVDRNGRKWIRDEWAPLSNCVRAGPILEKAREELGPQIDTIMLNKKSAKSPPMSKHKDGNNKGDSYVMLWGDFEGGGELCLETGERFVEKEIWHGPMNGKDVAHWVNKHESGTRFSAVAFTSGKKPNLSGPRLSKKIKLLEIPESF